MTYFGLLQHVPMGFMEKAVRTNAMVPVMVVTMLTGFVTKGVIRAGRASIVEKARYIITNFKKIKKKVKKCHQIICISELPFNF